MNNLPDNIIDKVYEYKHQLDYKHVMLDLRKQFVYCDWCDTWMLKGQPCQNCWDEHENKIGRQLFKIHCSRCGGAEALDTIPLLSIMCDNCMNGLNNGSTLYEVTRPKRYYERNPEQYYEINHERNHHII